MDKEVVVHLYEGILINLKKKRIWVTWAEVDEPTACYVEWTKSQRENQMLYVNVYVESRKMALVTYFQGRRRGTDREQVCGHKGGERASWIERPALKQYVTICKMLTDS